MVNAFFSQRSGAFSLSNRDSDIIKAISIIVIVVHNFVHLTNKIKENEHALDPDRILNFLTHLQSHPAGFFTYVFSYFGWYFVIPFIFISGYGLAKKHAKNKEPLTTIAATAVFKTAVLLLIGTLYIWATGYVSLEKALRILFHKLATIDNFTAERVFSGVGPWWYFSLAIQLYIIFPVVYKMIAWRDAGLLIVLLPAYALIYGLYFFVPKLNVFGTAFGQVPVFALGIFLARYQRDFDRRTLAVVALVSFFIFCFSQRYHVFFPLTYLSFMILFLFFYCGAKKYFDQALIVVIGKASAFIFVLNGPIRKQTMDWIGAGSAKYPNLHELFIFGMSFMHLIAVLAVSMMFFIGLDGAMRGASARFSRALDGAER